MKPTLNYFPLILLFVHDYICIFYLLVCLYIKRKYVNSTKEYQIPALVVKIFQQFHKPERTLAGGANVLSGLEPYSKL